MSAVISSEPISSFWKKDYDPHVDVAEDWLRYTNLLINEKTYGGLYRLTTLDALRWTVEGVRRLFPKRLPIGISIRVGEIKTLLGETRSRSVYGVGPWQGKTMLEAFQNWLEHVGTPKLETLHLWTHDTCANFRNAISEVRAVYPGDLPFEISERVFRIEGAIRRFEKDHPRKKYPLH